MALAITGTQWINVTTVDVSFNGAVDPEVAGRPNAWSVAATAPAPAVTIYGTAVKTGGLTVAVRIGPAAIPGAAYTISCDIDGNTISVLTTATPTLPVIPSPEWTHGLLRSITGAFGEAVQRFNGKPQTLVCSPLKPGDTSMYVESTLGFPPVGSLILQGNRYTYGSVSPMAFKGIGTSSPQFLTVAPRALVSFDVRSHLPD